MRPLSKDDWPFLATALRNLKVESPEYSYGEDSHKNEFRLWNYFVDGLDHGILFGVIEPDKGFMFGGISQFWADPRVVEAYEQLLYILPEHRGGLTAGKLIKAWERLAASKGATKVYAGATTGITDDRVIKLYQKLGWRLSNVSVEKDIVYPRTGPNDPTRPSVGSG